MSRSFGTSVLHQHNTIMLPICNYAAADMEPSTQSAEEHRHIVPAKALFASPHSDAALNDNDNEDKKSEHSELISRRSSTEETENKLTLLELKEIKKEIKEEIEEANAEHLIKVATEEYSDVLKNSCPSFTVSTCSSSQPPASPSTSTANNGTVVAGPTTKNSLKRRRAKPIVTDEAPRKSNRINRTAENEAAVLGNYTETVPDKPRNVQIPVGIQRVPYQFPRKAIKENDRLRIDMKGPSTRSNGDGSMYAPLSHIPGKQRQVKKENKATVPELREFHQAAEEEDRDECIWYLPEEALIPPPEILDPIITVINSQYDGEITSDAILRRLMVENYNVDKMLEKIELERERLPQPFEPFTYAQQLEFQRMLGRSNGNTVRPYKSFRGMQEKFLRTYHVGEIVAYYYKTKRRSCNRKLFARCGCQEKTLEHHECIAERVECENCTKTLRPMVVGTGKFCGICQLYFQRNQKHRESPGMLTEKELHLIEKWNEYEAMIEEPIRLTEVLEMLEFEKKNELSQRKLTPDEVDLVKLAPPKERKDPAKLLASFDINRTPTCCKAEGSIEFRVKDYSHEEKVAFLKAFEKHAKDFEKVAEELAVSRNEAMAFFNRFNEEFQISKMISYAKKKEKQSRESTPYEAPVPKEKQNRKRKNSNNEQVSINAPKRRSSRYAP